MMRRKGLFLACALLLACYDLSQAAGTKINTSDWRVLTLPECGIRLKLPRRYLEKHWAVTDGDPIGRSFRGTAFERIDIEVQPSPHGKLADNKTIRQRDYEGYTESTETIGGREAILQSFRGGGVIIGGGGQSTTYHAGAIWQLRPGQVLSIGGDVATPQAQREVLAALRTVEFLP